MYNKVKNILIIAIALIIQANFSSVFAAEVKVETGATFSMTEVSVVNENTLKIVFSKDLIEDASMFEFLLTPKADETREIVLENLVLSNSNEITANSVEPLSVSTEYNIVVVFASDKDGNIIENGVDGMITFVTPEVFEVQTEEVLTESAETPAEDLNSAPVEDVVTPNTTEVETANGITVKDLPETGTREMMIIILSMLLGLGFMYLKRRA